MCHCSDLYSNWLHAVKVEFRTPLTSTVLTTMAQSDRSKGPSSRSSRHAGPHKASFRPEKIFRVHYH